MRPDVKDSASAVSVPINRCPELPRHSGAIDSATKNLKILVVLPLGASQIDYAFSFSCNLSSPNSHDL